MQTNARRHAEHYKAICQWHLSTAIAYCVINILAILPLPYLTSSVLCLLPLTTAIANILKLLENGQTKRVQTSLCVMMNGQFNGDRLQSTT